MPPRTAHSYFISKPAICADRERATECEGMRVESDGEEFAHTLYAHTLTPFRRRSGPRFPTLAVWVFNYISNFQRTIATGRRWVAIGTVEERPRNRLRDPPTEAAAFARGRLGGSGFQQPRGQARLLKRFSQKALSSNRQTEKPTLTDQLSNGTKNQD